MGNTKLIVCFAALLLCCFAGLALSVAGMTDAASLVSLGSASPFTELSATGSVNTPTLPRKTNARTKAS